MQLTALGYRPQTFNKVLITVTLMKSDEAHSAVRRQLVELAFPYHALARLQHIGSQNLQGLLHHGIRLARSRWAEENLVQRNIFSGHPGISFLRLFKCFAFRAW